MTESVAAAPPPEVCANCGVALNGRFCHACGQDAAARTHSLRAFLAENLSDLAHLDSRGLRTIRDLLLGPGRLTAAYFAGHRVRYLPSVQLYLIAAALFFFANSVTPFIVVEGETWSVRASLGVLGVGEEMEADDRTALQRRGVTYERFEDRLRSTANNQLPAFLIAVVLLFALTVALFHPLRERNLLKHLVFALHWTAFYLVLMIAERVSGRQPGNPDALSAVLGVIGLTWMAVALRRTYRQRWAAVVPKTIGLFLIFHLLLALWIGVVLVRAIHGL